ncbi:FecR family protein [Yangia mangrovi]|uniref:FecR family protein n=1 Tax=Alloyangia mangrovi TaxID=1779329 RepID=A0A2A3JZB1_9RHOB|nr:FecR family protein [Alloyangia mangrovi]MCT4372245.1 FecR family protein [Alloyangia mangrovi]
MPDSQSRRQRHEEAAGWVLRQSRGPLGPAEEAAFQAWLTASAANRRSYESARHLFGAAGRAIASDPELSAFEANPARPRKKIAVMAAVFAVGLAGFFWADGPMRLRADVVARIDELPRVTLDDGTVLQLNASSAISVDFDAENRSVHLLRGQAYFEVAPDRDRPFSVIAGDTTVVALGTAFVVRLGLNDIEVTVTDHSVLLKLDDDDGTRMEEGQRGNYNIAGAQLEITPADRNRALAWRQGKLVLDDTPIADVIAEIDNRFAGRIMVPDEPLSQKRLSGTLDVTDPLSALSFLEAALDVRMLRIGPLIFIRPE